MVGSGGVKAETNGSAWRPSQNGSTRNKSGRGRRYRDENGSSDDEVMYRTTSLSPGIHPPQPKGFMRNGSGSSSPVTVSQISLTPDPSLGKKGSISTATGDSKRKVLYAEDENEERGNWSGRFDFILSMLGYAVGLGNIWRFPYLCYRNGGGAFLLPFLLMMVIIGLPLFFLEASLGQFCSQGPMGCWQFAPLFKGLGIAMVMVSGMTALYYNMILAWSLYYLFASFTSDLPWATCDNKEWNTEDCSLKLPLVDCEDGQQEDDGTCLDSTSGEFVGLWNLSLFTEVTGRSRVSPSEEYWNGRTLRLSDGIHNMGQPAWDLTLCLMLAWIICFLCLLKGIKTTGKVVYFTAIFPYVVLFILLIRGATLEGAGEGIYYFIVPDFDRLADARVWKDAANQIFFSMSIAGGGLITLSSYNRFKNNILRDSLIVAIGDSLTCVFGGFVIFSFLGYMAGQLHVQVKDVVKDGAGLAFVVYPEAVSSLTPPTLWSILFFVMLLTLGLDSQFAMLETVLTGVLDQYPILRPRKTFVVLIISIIGFILGLPLACPGGMYLLQLMDNYVGGLSLIIVGLFEIVAVIYVYGCKRFCMDINVMIGMKMFLYWQVTWMVLSPLTIIFILIFMFVDYSPSTYGDYTYPGWADALGWLMTLSTVISIPIVMLFKINREKEAKTVLGKLKLLTTPSVLWGPALPKHRELIHYVDGFEVDPFKKRDEEITGSRGFVNKAFVSDTPSKTPSRTPSRTPTIHTTSQMSLGITSNSMLSGISGHSLRSRDSRDSNSTTTRESTV